MCEQRCGRKGQGATEHLWAFMAQVDACLDGDIPDGEDTAGAYALFADVFKSYDQVWRAGMGCAWPCTLFG